MLLRPRIWQFSLRTALAMIVLIALPLGIFRQELRDYFFPGLDEEYLLTQTVFTLEEFDQLQAEERCVVLIDVDWSPTAIRSRKTISRFVWEWYEWDNRWSAHPRQPVSFYRLDLTDAGSPIWNPVHRWLDSQAGLVSSRIMSQGAGTVLWVRNGKVVDFIQTAMDATPENLAKRTSEAFAKAAP